MDRPIQISQEMVFAGGAALKASGVLPVGFDHVHVMVAVSRVYNAMRQLEKPVKDAEVFGLQRVGGK